MHTFPSHLGAMMEAPTQPHGRSAPMTTYRNYDPTSFGERLQAARILAKCKTPSRFAQRLQRAGVEITAGELRELEAGRQCPTWPLVKAVVSVAPVGEDFFEESLRP